MSGRIAASITPDNHFPHRYAAAAEDFNPIHLDVEAAAAAGLPGIVLHGLSTMGLAARLCLEQVDGDPRALRRIAVQFRGIGLPGEEISFAGTVTASEDEVHIGFTAVQGDRILLQNGVAELRS